jgi:hypothetical protein
MMNLHEEESLFGEIIAAASLPVSQGGLGIKPIFIEKDYWICRSLQLMSRSKDQSRIVFKGGTSLTKGYGIGHRFSEDIDIAISNVSELTSNQLKMLIKRVSKEMTTGLVEIVKPTTSKGSHYHKAYYAYPREVSAELSSINAGEVLLEINAFANPHPFDKRRITSFVYEFLEKHEAFDIIDQFNLSPFEVNILDKRRTFLEKIVSLIRASLGVDVLGNLQSKIRHFYDLHYLWCDVDCQRYVQSDDAAHDFCALLSHDRAVFRKPQEWNERPVKNSLLVKDLDGLWRTLSIVYERELSDLAFQQIPSSTSIYQSVSTIFQWVQSIIDD